MSIGLHEQVMRVDHWRRSQRGHDRPLTPAEAPQLPPLNLELCSVHRATRTSLVAQTVKCLPTMRETWVQSLGGEDLLEKEMATHSSILAWRIPWMEEPGSLQSMGLQRVRHD